MKKHLLFFSLSILIASVSCKDDEPKINPIVGEWELDEVIVTNPPSSFSNAEGLELSGLYGEEQYVITFNSDMTYERELENAPTQSGTSDFSDEGTWEVDGDELRLEMVDGDDLLDYEFNILDEITDKKLNLELSGSIFFLSDAILTDPVFQDTVETQAQYNAVFNERAEEIDVDFTLEFNKQ